MKNQLPKDLARVVTLAEKCTQPGDELVRVYLIDPQERPYRPGSLRRAGGPPIGVDEHTRPRWRGAFMQHLLTIDLDDVPEIRAIGDLADARALALFISDAGDNEAFDPGTSQTALVRLTESDLARGEWSGEPVADPKPQAFYLHPVDVPTRVFYDDFAPEFDEDGVDADLADLHDDLVSGNRIGGPVIHWSCDTRSKDFILQFAEDIVDVNLGDAGTMYVYADTAYWSCH